MTSQKIMWTALPHGFHEGAPRLSAFVSPRLTSTTGRLDEFPDFMEWPARINAMTFTVETEEGTFECRRISPEADPAVWTALFRPDTFVDPFEFRDFAQRAIRTLPVRSVTQYLTGLYRNVATASPQVVPKLFAADDDEDDAGTLAPLLRDLGGVLPLEVNDPDGALDRFAGGEVDDETAALFSLPRMMTPLAATMRRAPLAQPQLDELKASARFTALDEVLAEKRVIDTRADETHGFASKAALDFFQTHRFYDRPEKLTERVAGIAREKAPPPPEPPKIDFHKMMSLLGDHPYLMRKLGIVVDLVAEGLPPSGRMRVRANPGETQPLTETTHVFPWTRFETTEGLFVASPEKDEMEDGMLRLDDVNDDPDSTSADYDVIQVDVDGAALKAVNLAVTAARGIARQRLDIARKTADLRVAHDLASSAIRPEVLTAGRLTLGREAASVKKMVAGRIPEVVEAVDGGAPPAEETRPDPSPPPPDRAGLAPMRSAGIAVARVARATQVAAKLEAAAAAHGQTDEDEIVHFADNLVRGYRVDIFDDHTGTWHSLCRRIGSYRLETRDGKPLFLEAEDGSRDIAEEGYVKGATTTSDGTDGGDLYLHETMFRWDGWSLSAPRPGRTIRAEVDSDGRQREVVERPKPQAATQFKMEATFRVEPGTLPRLRFGHTYKIRARCVDLAGNSLALDEVGDVHASEEITYVRFDPVVPPQLVPRARFTEGESLNRMVIRSNFDADAQTYVKSEAVEGALKDAEHDYTVANDRHLVPPKTSQQMAECHGAFDEWMGRGKSHQEAFELATREAGALDHTHVVVGEDADGNPRYEALEGSETVPGRVPPGAPAGTPPTGGYVVNTKERFPLAYLPDWLARGVAFRGLPGTDEPYVHVYEGEWPDRRPIRIRIVERKGTLDPKTCVQEFDDPPEPRMEDGMLIVPLPKGEVARVRYSSFVDRDDYRLMGQQRWLGGGGDDLGEIVDRGEHWMFTPHRELILVHAVQQPLCAPAFATQKVEGSDESRPLAATHRELGDTFATLTGMVRLSVKTTAQVDVRAKWQEPKDLLADPTWKMVPGAALVETLPVHSRLQEPEVPIPFPDMDRVPGATPWEEVLRTWEKLVGRRIKHEFGDTKHRWVEYSLVGTTRFREYFPPALTKDPKNLTREGPVARLNVLSSARPDAPRVEYIVPSFKWEEELSEEGGWKLVRKRVGGGLRVYLHRPWFSSGEGELLGVVLWTKGFETLYSDENQRFRTLVSTFGRDPVWASGPLDPGVDRSFFPADPPGEDELSLDETDLEKVGVVGFAPEFDPGRKMWFCDVELGPKAQTSYYPFIRLALARYQPDSLPDAKLSRVVQTDYAQVVPNRTLTVTKKGDRAFDVTVYGPAPDAPFPNRVEVELQVHDGTVAGDLGWTSLPHSPDQPNPVILRPGFPDEATVPAGISEVLLRGRIFSGARPGGDVATTARVEPGTPAAGGGEGEGEVAAVDAGAALHFARVVEPGNLPVVDARVMREILPKGFPEELVAKFPPALLRGYETWSGSITVPEGVRGKVRLLVCEFEHFAADPEVGKLDRDEIAPKIDGPYLDRVVYADTVELPL
ncbi:MAG: hypothetical protein ABR613_03690 [Actinomycetota bacterium]